MSWTDEEIQTLRDLAARNEFFMSEIAEKLNRKPAIVRWKAHQLGISSKTGRFAEWNIKHKHLHEKVMKYFLTHSMEETAEYFGLSRSHLKSIFTTGYRDPKFSHLRKDRRRHDNWSVKELLFLAQHGGIQSRDWIAKKLKRGTMQSTKECLKRLKIHSRYINGLPVKLARLIVPDIQGIKTTAGAPGCGGECHIICVPWVTLEREIKGKRISSEYRLSIKAMARFQRWIHNSKSDQSLIRKLKRTADAK